MRILAYVKSSPGKSLLYKMHEHVRIFGYSDSGYAGDKGDGKFTTIYCTFVGENMVTWRSRKQDVFRFSVEIEYRAMTHTSEMMWLKNLLKLGFRQLGPMPIFCDNQSIIYIAQNHVFVKRTKHIKVDCHLVRDAWTMKVVSLPFTPSSK